MRVYSICNFKGGTGKTITCVNLAANLARCGKRVLAIDADPQHNLSDFFCEDWDGATLTDVLEGTAEPYYPENLADSGYDNLSILCSDMGLLRLDLAAILNGSNEAQRRMADLFAAMAQDDAFDFVLIDCPPSFTAASVAALANSDGLILPTRLDAWSRRGVVEMIEQARSAGRHMSNLNIRVLLTMVDKSNLARQGEEILRGMDGLNVYDTVIHAGVAAGESTYVRQPLYEYKPRSRVARDYERLTMEVLCDGK